MMCFDYQCIKKNIEKKLSKILQVKKNVVLLQPH